MTNSSTLISVSVYLAKAGVCARRKAGLLVQSGQVTVNGQMITEPGYKLQAGDEVRYLGQLIQSDALIYILLNKPARYVTTVSDQFQRPTVLALLGDQIKTRLYPVGRLDYLTTGLLLLTNDGALAQKLAHPKYARAKVYQVTLERNFTAVDLARLQAGLQLSDGVMQPDQIMINPRQPKQVLLTIHSGRNRIVRRLFQALGYQVCQLDRVQYAGLTKAGLKVGQWGYLTAEEVECLKG
ncbi:MAG TPA: pseudouridine synthase [Candidatus Babeliales bacterium]|nr:pseudouridine synthase [Candidatus Babeliales bacterium]